MGKKKYSFVNIVKTFYAKGLIMLILYDHSD